MNRTYLILITTLAVVACKPRDAKEPEQTVITAVTASSELKPSKNHNYWAGLAFDGRFDSSWVEGAKDDGLGEFLKIQLNHPFKLTEFTMANGFGIERYWKTNNRVRDLAVSAGGAEVIVTLKDTMAPQPVKLPRALEGKEFIFKIRSVYRGTKDRDTAIAELSIPNLPWAAESIPEAVPASTASADSAASDGSCRVGSEIGIQSSNTIKFRSEPSYSASSFTEYSTGPGAGDIVRIERCSDGWIYANYRGHSGWISPKYQCANLESNCIGAGE